MNKKTRRQAAAHRSRQPYRKTLISLEEFYRMLSGIRDEMERETDDLMGQEPKPGAPESKTERRAAHTIWNKLDVSFMRSESVQDFAEQAVKDMGGYDEYKAKHETDRGEQDKRMRAWETKPNNNLGLK